MKRVFIIHGWDGSPEGWIADLKTGFEKIGFEAVAPQMPNAAEPKIEEWIAFLSALVGKPDEETFFVGHSIGCQTILRYAESIYPQKIGGAFFVAGWFHLTGLEDDKEKELAKPWIETPLDFEKVKTVIPKMAAIFSDNDPYVPLSDKDIFAEKLDAKISVKNRQGHFTQSGPFDTAEIIKELTE